MTVLPVTRIQLNDEQIKFITNLPSKNRDCFIDVELRANDEESFPGNMHGELEVVFDCVITSFLSAE